MNTELVPRDVSVALTVPAAPTVILKAEVVSKIDDIAATAAVVEIADADSAQLAADYIISATTLEKEMRAAVKEAKKPADEYVDAITAAVKDHTARLANAKASLQQKAALWQAQESARLRREQEARDAELRRQVAEQRKREADQRAAEEAARLANLPPPPPMAPAPEPAISIVVPAASTKPSGLRFRCTLLPLVVDASKIPDAFVTREPDMPKIRRHFCAPWREGEALPVVPGLEFTIDRTAISAGAKQ